MSDSRGALGKRKRKRSLGEDDSLLPSEEETDSIASVSEDEYADSCSADDYGDLLGGEDEDLDNTAGQSVPIRMRPDVARRIRENKEFS